MRKIHGASTDKTRTAKNLVSTSTNSTSRVRSMHVAADSILYGRVHSIGEFRGYLAIKKLELSKSLISRLYAILAA